MRYGYFCKKHGNIYETDHSMKVAFSTMKELLNYVREQDAPLEIVGAKFELFEVEEDLDKEDKDCLCEECGEIEKYIYPSEVIFKGAGWPSKENRCRIYRGKKKGMYEKMRHDRHERAKQGLSVQDARRSVGLGPGDTVVENRDWEKLTAGEKDKAAKLGLRPSRSFKK